MLRCERCGFSFPAKIVIAGKVRDLRGRKRCLDCLPFRSLRKPRRPVVRQVQVLMCVSCGDPFPARQVIVGRMRTLYRRSFCLTCSPFAGRNSSKYPVGRSGDPDRARKARRRESYRRSLRKRRQQRKRELVAQMGGCCADCGYDVTVVALEFHHRDPATKAFAIGGFNGSLDRLVSEALKCDLICANCHRKRHALEDAKLELSQTVELRRNTKIRAVAMFGATCYGCESEFISAVFEFHHWSAQTKEFGVAAEGLNRPWPKVAAELAKCVMLCANCHREVHAGIRVLDEGPLGLAEDAAAYVA